jgi:hypothetical protein
MNERSFIVKFALLSRFPKKTQHHSIINTPRHESRKDAPLRRKFRHSAQRDAPGYSPRLAAAFTISSPTLLSQRAKQPERVALRGRTQRTDLASVAR